jgi:hypothetical protein
MAGDMYVGYVSPTDRSGPRMDRDTYLRYMSPKPASARAKKKLDFWSDI